MGQPRTSVVLVFFLVFITAATKWSSCSRSSNNSLSSSSSVGCKPYERNALLNFKHSLTSFDRRVFSSWEGEDCCKWRRVSCDHTTGHVLQLHLHGNCSTELLDHVYPYYHCDYLLEARNLESSLLHLLELKHLGYLDLSVTNFNYSRIPKSIGSMKHLRYLNLSNTLLSGLTPHELGNLTNLQFLDMSYTYLDIDSLRWAYGLRQLRYLDLSRANLSQTHDWMDSSIGLLPSLRELRLSDCGLSTYYHKPNFLINSSLVPPTNPIRYLDLERNYLTGGFPQFIQNLTSLEYLNLGSNNFGSKIPLWLGKLHNLVHLYLGYNDFTGVGGGNIWGVVGNICSLRSLDLSFNSFHGNLLEPHPNSSTTNCSHFDLELLYLSNNKIINGGLPTWLMEDFRNLRFLHLSNNNISSEIATSLGQLLKLQELDISNNPNLKGTVLIETHFANLSSLKDLDMEGTFLTLKLPSDWMPPFQLESFFADSCKINGHLPRWLRTQKHLKYLLLSNASISGVIPKWFHTMQQLQFLDLSYNFISGPLPENLHLIRMPGLRVLTLSNNQINGSIPVSTCKFPSLQSLDLQKNRLSRAIPNCWENSSDLSFISLSYNMLSGVIPCFFSKNNRNGTAYKSHSNLAYLHLNDNNLSGQIPSCLSKATDLQLLDIGGNKLSGKIPTWITGEKLGKLQILRLRGNKLRGIIPPQLCSLPQLKLLDLGHNHFTGTIPHCLHNLTAMNSSLEYVIHEYNEKDSISEVIQGIERAYTTTLVYLVSIDLSCNSLVGRIPEGITNLSSLLNLNLSSNHLSGQIPQHIGGLKSLVSLDLSRNRLWGAIPGSMAELYFLEYLNLSYNNFSGRIPSGKQLQTLNDPLIYAGNPYLCGDLLPKKCTSNNDNEEHKGSGQDEGDKGEDKEDKREKMWFCLIVMSGFATGFWGVVGTLLMKRSWRHALFRRVEDALDWLYVAIVVRMAKLKKK